MPDTIIESNSNALSMKEQIIKKYPHYKDWPHWDTDGFPVPPPEEVNAIIAKGLEVSFD